MVNFAGIFGRQADAHDMTFHLPLRCLNPCKVMEDGVRKPFRPAHANLMTFGRVFGREHRHDDVFGFSGLLKEGVAILVTETDFAMRGQETDGARDNTGVSFLARCTS